MNRNTCSSEFHLKGRGSGGARLPAQGRVGGRGREGLPSRGPQVMLSGLPGPSLTPPQASRILLPPSLRDLLAPFPHPQPWLGFYSPTHTC